MSNRGLIDKTKMVGNGVLGRWYAAIVKNTAIESNRIIE